MEEEKKYRKNKVFPVNQMDSAWQSAVPDFSNYQNTFEKQTKEGKMDPLVNFFSMFSSNIRLSNITTEEAVRVEYDINTASQEYFHNLPKCFHDSNVKISALLEPRQSRKGFRTEAMNKIIQDIKQTTISNKPKKNIFGGENKDDNN